MTAPHEDCWDAEWVRKDPGSSKVFTCGYLSEGLWKGNGCWSPLSSQGSVTESRLCSELERTEQAPLPSRQSMLISCSAENARLLLAQQSHCRKIRCQIIQSLFTQKKKKLKSSKVKANEILERELFYSNKKLCRFLRTQHHTQVHRVFQNKLS